MRDGARPLTHEWIWTAIDTLASRNGLTASALARLAGLDPTTFNKSKRFTAEGRPRWPSTESIAKVLEATSTSLDEFAAIPMAGTLEVSFDERSEGPLEGIPVVGEIRNAAVASWQPPPPTLATAAAAGEAWRHRRFALAVADASLEPVYSRGHTLVVSEAASSRPGDRVVVKPVDGQAIPRLLVSTSPTTLELAPFDGSSGSPVRLPRRRLDWMARIVLVRQ